MLTGKPSDAKNARRLVEDPEELLDVLEDLVGDDDVHRPIGEREDLPLDVDRVDAYALGAKAVHELRPQLDPEELRCGVELPRRSEVHALTRADVERRRDRSGLLEERADEMTARVEAAIDQGSRPR